MKVPIVLLVLLGAAYFPTASHGARILCFFPVPVRSVVVFAQELMMKLAENGHQVTMVSPFALDLQLQNYRDIVIPIPGSTDALPDFPVNRSKRRNIFLHINDIQERMTDAALMTLKHPDFQKLMRDEQFDLVVMNFIFTTFQHGIAAHFKCPYVLLSSAPVSYYFTEMIGQPTSPEAVSSFFTGYTEPMSFYMRFKNMVAIVSEYVFVQVFDYRNSWLYREHFPSPQYPDFEDVKKNVSLIFVNSHFTLYANRPLLPNVVEISGLQIREKPNPLPADLEKWINDATHGIVLVVFGSAPRARDLSNDHINMLLNTFNALKQRVIWKYESDDVPDLPPNVMVQKWLPQNDILAHHKVKLFISTCGISSNFEALFHAVPVVCIPMTGDEPYNAKKLAIEGWAETVPLETMTQERLDMAVSQVLTNGKYRKAVRKRSSLYRDRPMTALQTAVYWVEYILRHRGAPHLKYQAADLYWWQRASLDVLAFAIVVVYGLVVVLSAFWRATVWLARNLTQEIRVPGDSDDDEPAQPEPEAEPVPPPQPPRPPSPQLEDARRRRRN